MLVKKNRLRLSIPVADWVAGSRRLPFLHFVPVDVEIARRSVELPPPLHPDPADRIIVATALATGAVLVTRDARLQAYPEVETVW